MEWVVVDLTSGAIFVREGNFVDKPAADAYIAAQPAGLKLLAVNVTVT